MHVCWEGKRKTSLQCGSMAREDAPHQPSSAPRPLTVTTSCSQGLPCTEGILPPLKRPGSRDLSPTPVAIKHVSSVALFLTSSHRRQAG